MVMFNTGAERMFGWSEEEMLGQSTERLMPLAYGSPHYGAVERFLETRGPTTMARPIEREGLRRDGTVSPMELSLGSYETSRGLLFVVAIRDITERKAGEEGLSKLNEELEQRVKECTQELSKANIGLHAANEKLEAFSYSVSHDRPNARRRCALQFQ